MKKRGQITLFMIIAVLILIAGFIYMYISKPEFLEKKNIEPTYSENQAKDYSTNLLVNSAFKVFDELANDTSYFQELEKHKHYRFNLKPLESNEYPIDINILTDKAKKEIEDAIAEKFEEDFQLNQAIGINSELKNVSVNIIYGINTTFIKLNEDLKYYDSGSKSYIIIKEVSKRFPYLWIEFNLCDLNYFNDENYSLTFNFNNTYNEDFAYLKIPVDERVRNITFKIDAVSTNIIQQQEQGKEGMDIVFAIDSTGSMGYDPCAISYDPNQDFIVPIRKEDCANYYNKGCKIVNDDKCCAQKSCNDLDNNRMRATNAILDKMNKSKDNAAIISWDSSFSDNEIWDDSLSNFVPCGDSNAIDFATELTNDFDYLKENLNNIDACGATGFDPALQKSVEILDNNYDKNRTQIILFLTDGECTAYPSYHEMTENECTCSESTNCDPIQRAIGKYKIYTIGLGDFNYKPLKDIADITNGKFYEVLNSENLYETFSNIFEREENGGIFKASIDIADDNIIEWQNNTNTSYVYESSDVQAINDYLDNCPEVKEGYCYVPIRVTGSNKVTLSDLCIEYGHECDVTVFNENYTSITYMFDEDGNTISGFRYIEKSQTDVEPLKDTNDENIGTDQATLPTSNLVPSTCAELLQDEHCYYYKNKVYAADPASLVSNIYHYLGNETEAGIHFYNHKLLDMGEEETAEEFLKRISKNWYDMPTEVMERKTQEFAAHGIICEHRPDLFIYVRDNDPLANLIENCYGSYDFNTGKPVIYLYPTKEIDVSVKVFPLGKFIASEPDYNNGWFVHAYPNGKLYNYEDNKWYPYLFWEAENSPLKLDDNGFVVNKNRLNSFFNATLKKYGLNKKETHDFKEFWVPRMKKENYNYYLIKFMETREFTKAIPIEVNPKPDTIIRIYMMYQGLDKPIEIKKPKIITPVRKGFTLVEWGGALRK